MRKILAEKSVEAEVSEFEYWLQMVNEWADDEPTEELECSFQLDQLMPSEFDQ